MGRLFLKLYSILAIVVLVYFVGIANLDNILQGTVESYSGNLSKGTFSLLEKRLTKIPQDQWPTVLEEINQGEGYMVRLLSLQSLEIPQSKIDRLKEGKIVLSDFRGAHSNLKRVNSSEWVLEFLFEQPEYKHNQKLSNSTFNLFDMVLQDQPQNNWASMIENISLLFTFPVILEEIKQIELTHPQQLELANDEIVWQETDDFIYRRVGKSPYVIRIGPFDEPITLNYLQTILVVELALLVALAVLIWIYPLWRDLKRLSASAKIFGQGDFSARAPIPRRSVLYRLAETFNSMANRIQGLISSHKELTNAVSHELRTPIARLRFGMEMLQSSNDEVNRARYISSMNADIDELDQLVAELLTYARFDRDKPTLKFKRQEIEPWLTDVIKQANIGKDDPTINFNIANKALIYANFEPKLLARALANLLQNARRYAQSKVSVTFAYEHKYYQISVEDDGPGVAENDREHIFEAFKRLDASRDRGTGGFGLGLAIVQRIMQWHGGEVEVKDSILGGAQFIIRWIRWPENDNTLKPKQE